MDLAKCSYACVGGGMAAGLLAAIVGYCYTHSAWGGGALGGLVFFVAWLASNHFWQLAVSKTRDCCAAPGEAVQYLGWYGTVHEFLFSNRQYIQDFVQANGRKTMSDIRQL
jgi:hypothetical protein